MTAVISLHLLLMKCLPDATLICSHAPPPTFILFIIFLFYMRVKCGWGGGALSRKAHSVPETVCLVNQDERMVLTA